MFRMRSVWAVVVVAASVLLLVPVIWAEEKEVSSATEFEVVIPKVTIDVKDTPVSQVLAEQRPGRGASGQQPPLGAAFGHAERDGGLALLVGPDRRMPVGRLVEHAGQCDPALPRIHRGRLVV